jgi:hypothetical protein
VLTLIAGLHESSGGGFRAGSPERFAQPATTAPVKKVNATVRTIDIMNSPGSGTAEDYFGYLKCA